jgi:hypothetical protein
MIHDLTCPIVIYAYFLTRERTLSNHLNWSSVTPVRCISINGSVQSCFRFAFLPLPIAAVEETPPVSIFSVLSAKPVVSK